MMKLGFGLRRQLLVCLAALILALALGKPLLHGEQKAPETAPPSGSLEMLANDFWQWRARYQPFSQDDIPRIERPAEDGARDWSAGSIAKQKAALGAFEKRWKRIDPTGWSVARQVDYRL